MSNVLNFRLTLEDLLGPKVAAAIQKVQQLGQQVDKPHRLNVDTSQAKGALTGIMGLVGKLGLAAAFATGAKEVIGLGADMEATRLRYEVFAGSAERAGQAIGIVAKLATKTPFAKTELLEYGQQLLGAELGADEMGRKLTVLGNISSATGKNLGELTSLYVKNKGNGLIQGEDLNQLADAKIPLQDFAAMLGTNVQGLRKMGEQGRLTFSDLDKYFEKLGGTQGKWGTLNERMSNTLIGKWSNLKDTVEQMMSSVGEGQVPIIGKLLDGGNKVLTFIQQNSDKMSAMFAPVVSAMQPLFDAFDRIRQQLFGNAEAGSILAIVFNGLANGIVLMAPILKVVFTLLGKVVGVVWDLIKGVAKFIQTHEWIQKYYAAIWGGAVAAFRGIADAAGKFLGGVGHLLQGILTMDWSVLKQGFAETIASMGQGPKIATDMAKGAVKGWNEGIKPIRLFGTDKAAGTDAASAFSRGAGTQKAGAMTAAASKGTTAGGVAGVGGKGITNIYFTVQRMLPDMKVEMMSAGQSAKEIAQLVRDTVIAELNDVNTLASTN